MRSFIKKVFIFGIVIVLVCLVMETVLLFLPNQFSYKADYMRKNGHKINILLLGASQTVNCINPDIIEEGDSCFNAGISAEPICMTYMTLAKYVKYMPNLRTVLISLNPIYIYNTYEYNTVSANKGMSVSSLRCMFHKYMRLPYDNKDIFYFSEIINSSFDWGGRFIHEDGWLKDTRPNGYQPFMLSSRQPRWWEEQIVGGPESITTDKEKAMRLNFGYMKKLIGICQSRGIKVFLVNIPFYKSSPLQAEVRSDFYRFMNGLVNSCPDVCWHDYTLDEKNFSPSDFYNATHLDEIGSDKWSRMIAKWMRDKMK